jgi:hypothetical protein
MQAHPNSAHAVRALLAGAESTSGSGYIVVLRSEPTTIDHAYTPWARLQSLLFRPKPMCSVNRSVTL